jgi:uncharacterized protein (DUF342 family)
VLGFEAVLYPSFLKRFCLFSIAYKKVSQIVKKVIALFESPCHNLIIETETRKNDMTKDNQKKLMDLVRDYGVMYSIFEEKLNTVNEEGFSDSSYAVYKDIAEGTLKEIQELIA